MRVLSLAVLFNLLVASLVAQAAPVRVDDYHWTGVERIVAIGDIHGDYEHYIATLELAGLINSRGKWIGGETHLVQTGDIPDRGPDTVKIIQHMKKLSRAAEKKGGRVHNLMGNHEAMNVYGDLRYVSPGEFEAFADRGSENLRDRYYQAVLADLETRDPERFAALPENHREEWEKTHPLGWVEHRQAWDPAWNPEGEYFEWAMDTKVAVQVNDLIFLHGGISGFYCQNSLESLTRKVHDALHPFDPANASILEDEYGPLWYRGLSGVKPEAPDETVAAILEQHGAGHIVVGHTPTSGVIWPRYDGRVIMIDTGIGSAYGGHVAFLEVTPEGLFAGYPGGKLPLPMGADGQVAYLQQVIAMDPDNRFLQQRMQALTAPAPEPVATAKAGESAPVDDGGDSAGNAESGETGQPETDAATAPVADPMPICGISL